MELGKSGICLELESFDKEKGKEVKVIEIFFGFYKQKGGKKN